MKSLIFLLAPIFCFGQTNDSLPRDDDNKISYERVIQLPGKSKDSIFDRVKDYVTTIVSIEGLQSEDRKAGFFAYKGLLEQLSTSVLLKFYIKDEKMKIIMTDFILIINSKPINYEDWLIKSKVPNDVIKDINGYVNEILNTIEKNMRKKSPFDF